MYLSTYLPIYLSTYLSTYLPIYLSTYLPIYLSTYLPIYLSTYLPIYLPIYLSTYLSTCLYLSTYLCYLCVYLPMLPICPIYLPIYLSIYLSTYLPTYLYLPMRTYRTYLPKGLRSASIQHVLHECYTIVICPVILTLWAILWVIRLIYLTPTLGLWAYSTSSILCWTYAWPKSENPSLHC